MNKKNIFAFLEIALILTLLFILDITNKFFGYIFVDPNPYFIFSILIAIRYGINFSLLSGSISTFYIFLSIFFNARNDFFKFIISWTVLKNPLYIFLFGFIIGFFRDMYIQKINYQNEQINLLKEKVKSLEEDIRKYKNITDDLEHKLVLEKQGVSLLVEKLKDIEYNNSEDIFNEAIDLISEFIYAKTVSIYTLSKNNFLRMKVRKGPQFLPNSLPVDKSVVISMAMEFGSANANVLYLTEVEYNFEYEPAMAVSVKHGKEILGFIIIEIIDPEKINKNTEIYLKILADWLSTLLLASSKLSENQNPDFLTSEKFSNILEKIEERRKRFGIPYSVVIVKYNNINSINLFKKFIRDTDFLFIDKNKKEIKIILTSCSKDGLTRVLDNFSYENIKVMEAYTKQ
ncbi:hypothetical protein X275_03240 [Marinitoga sp. 1197]|uniref:hypothetical protein n=1 Tax=Marinitoga sp. 1197 TaxID=1428449 RepID=UPI000640DA0A|nr:hypothetical protein [Marinitoga sp. 1197]KLO23339.1 hypothetical protein X275_03240 [Marinitoga sp. 1197]